MNSARRLAAVDAGIRPAPDATALHLRVIFLFGARSQWHESVWAGFCRRIKGLLKRCRASIRARAMAFSRLAVLIYFPYACVRCVSSHFWRTWDFPSWESCAYKIRERRTIIDWHSSGAIHIWYKVTIRKPRALHKRKSELKLHIQRVFQSGNHSLVSD